MNANSTSKTLGRVLVVDDHRAARESVIDVLRQTGYAANGAASATEALPLLEREPCDVVITDLQMPGVDGLEFIRQIAQRRLQVEAIMVTAHATIPSAVEAMRHGAFDYLEKPFDAARLEQLVAQAMERRRLHVVETKAASGERTNDDSFGPLGDLGMVGASEAIERLRERIRCVAPTNETVLICGESGVGKELVAQAIHNLSRRSGGPLVSLNCPALSPQLAESELFGHRRGAFTGADADRVGRFELARGGSLFLDEITEIELPLQAKLLRVLQQRTYEQVGSSETVAADVRVIASTNRNLLSEIAVGRFREDLYFRLAVVPLELPPLRSRGDDVLILAEYFLDRAARRLERPRATLSDGSRELLAKYHWPGNVRELENLITRACVLTQNETIAEGDLRPWMQAGCSEQTADEASLPVELAGRNLNDLERATIVATLEQNGGNRAKTAAALGIGVRTLSGKLRTYGFAPRAREFGSSSGDRQMAPNGSAESADGGQRRAL